MANRKTGAENEVTEKKSVKKETSKTEKVTEVKTEKVTEVKTEKVAETKKETDEEGEVNLVKAVLMVVFGLVGIVFGSDLVVKGASEIAATFGVSQRIISLTIVALGTSLPELVTSVIATRKGEYDIAIGNIVGSDIFNIGIVAGLPVALLGGVGGSAFSVVDIAALVISPIVLYFFARRGHRIGFKKGIAFLLMFVVYYGYVIMGSFA